MIARAIPMAVLASGCLFQQNYGAVTPTRFICKLGSFRQELALSPDFKVDRRGDDAYPPDEVVRDAVASDAVAIAKFTRCPGTEPVGVLKLSLHRIEVGTTRDRTVKALMWTLFLVPTLGLSTIYTLSEERWLTLELDATLTVGDHQIWSGEFTSRAKAPVLTDLPTTGSQLTALALRAQEAAGKDLRIERDSK